MIFSSSFRVFFVLLLTSLSVLSADAVLPVTEALPDFEKMNGRKDHEIEMLDQLILVTQKNLERQKQLRAQLAEYLDLQARYIENTDDKELSIKLVRKAQQVLEGIQHQHLTHAFDQEFISELSFFAGIAQKWDSPRL